jgi:hypothetical protein
METIFLRFLVALLFVFVETVFVVALHTYFSKPMDRMKNWFGRHSWKTIAIMLPLLFVANFAVSFVFWGVATAPGTPAEAAQPEVHSDRETPDEEAPSSPSTPAGPKRILPSEEDLPEKRHSDNEPEPIPGVPADETL